MNVDDSLCGLVFNSMIEIIKFSIDVSFSLSSVERYWFLFNNWSIVSNVHVFVVHYTSDTLLVRGQFQNLPKAEQIAFQAQFLSKIPVILAGNRILLSTICACFTALGDILTVKWTEHLFETCEYNLRWVPCREHTSVACFCTKWCSGNGQFLNWLSITDLSTIFLTN